MTTLKRPGSRSPQFRATAKAAFIVLYSQGHSMSHAAREAGVTRKTIYEWRKDDLDFDQAVRDAYDEGTDCYEDLLYERAQSGNMAAIIFGLKMRGRYRQGQTAEEEDRGYDFHFMDLAEEAEAINRAALTGSEVDAAASGV